METTTNGGLFKRIALVMAAVRSLPKDGYNEQNKFYFVSSDTALDKIGKAMAENNLVIIPMLTDYETVDEPKGNSVRTRTRARFQMHICDSDGNAFLCPWAAEGVDYGNPERALNKAMTNATKFFLMKLFVVGAGGEDPDGEATEAATAARTPAKAQTATRTANATQKPATPAKPPTAQTAQTPVQEDALFDEKTAHPPATNGGKAHVSQVRLNRLHDVGTKAYGKEWNEKRHQLVQMISKGAITSSRDLTPKEAEDLISGIERKLAEAEKQPVANGKAA